MSDPRHRARNSPALDPRTLKLGPSYKVKPTPTLRAELEHVLGPAALVAV